MENFNAPVLESICEFVYRGTPSAIWRTQNNGSAMFSQAARRSACQFVYRGIVGAFCRARNNRGPIFSPPATEAAIQKVAKYGIVDPYMVYANFVSIVYKSTYLVCITRFSENF
jgi:hypothetical protein